MKSKINYAGVDGDFCSFDAAKVLLQSIPYDGTSTWGKGADKGFEAFLDASENMELFDFETRSEVYKQGVFVLPAIVESSSPEAMYQAVYDEVSKNLVHNKFLSFFGGEHSVSIGIIDAFLEKHPQMSVLQIDAHADLRKSYGGTEFNHACAVHRASQKSNLVQVGIRSMDISELEYMDESKVFFAEDMYGTEDWMDQSIDLLGDDVYLTIDLDAFDPSIMPATGTPEPGGIDWNTMIKYLRKLFQRKNVLGFDLVELAPIEGLHGPNFLAAKLYYKILSYKFHG